MSVTEETRIATLQEAPEANLSALQDRLDRRADVDLKQTLIGNLLKDVGCDGLLVLEEENFSWLTGGAIPRGIVDREAMPGLYLSGEGRWLLSSNVDTQRLFDEEIDGLGFQLKEWPWHWGRAQLLADLCQGRNVACDQALGSSKVVADLLLKLRRTLTEYERACYRALGTIVSHALEATGRSLARGDTEREVAGQLSHRLMHRGATPLMISVLADGRSRPYRQAGYTATPIQNYAVLNVTARKYGLCARASRTVAFGQPDAALRRDHDAACKVSATYVAGSWPDSVPRQILAAGQRIYQIVGAPDEWTLSPQGHLTGRAVMEMALTPRVEELLQNHCAITWHASVGAAVSCDTFLMSEDGPISLTSMENWPPKRIRIQGAEYVRPDLLVR
jgi:Xaa-Pro dipeptidase